MSLPLRDITPLAGQLEHTLSTGLLPPDVTGWGSQLLQRLRQPVRVAVTGAPGTGKSALIDMLLGRVVIGKAAAGLPVEICHGPEERVVFDTPAGTRGQQPGCLANAAVPPDALRVRQHLPDPRLRAQSYLEIPLAGSPGRQQETLQQAAAMADIILWCSETFPEAEQALWSAMPDSTKDHSFLVLTMADRQIMRGVLPGLIQSLEPVAAEEFLGVYPVAAIQGLTAQTAGTPAEDLWRSSGGRQLAEDVQRQIGLGRASDADQAELLIRQFGGSLPAEAPPPPAAKAASPAAAPHAPAASLAAALDQLQSGAEDMLARAEASGGPQAGPVLAQCMDLIRGLSASLEGLPGSAAVTAACDAAQDGEELLMLCQLEQDEDAAIDAVTLLFQLKKELAEDSPG